MTFKTMPFESYTPAGTTIEERLASIGVTLLQEALTSEWIGLVRLAIAEARRFPVLGSRIAQMTQERGAEIGVRLLGDVTESLELGKLPAFGPEAIPITAGYFMDLIFLPCSCGPYRERIWRRSAPGSAPMFRKRSLSFLRPAATAASADRGQPPPHNQEIYREGEQCDGQPEARKRCGP